MHLLFLVVYVLVPMHGDAFLLGFRHFFFSFFPSFLSMMIYLIALDELILLSSCIYNLQT